MIITTCTTTVSTTFSTYYFQPTTSLPSCCVGGYVWSAYTSVFFSALFVNDAGTQGADACKYSYNATYVSDSMASVCDSRYPYCVDSLCVALSTTPWHNTVSSNVVVLVII